MIPPNTDDVVHGYIAGDSKSTLEFIEKDIEFEECSIYDDLNSPFVKFMSMLAAIFVVMVGIIGALICCSYCQLEQQYKALSQVVTTQQQEVGLPDDFEYEEDNVYMEDLRREQMSYRQRQAEDGIIQEGQQ